MSVSQRALTTKKRRVEVEEEHALNDPPWVSPDSDGLTVDVDFFFRADDGEGERVSELGRFGDGLGVVVLDVGGEVVDRLEIGAKGEEGRAGKGGEEGEAEREQVASLADLFTSTDARGRGRAKEAEIRSQRKSTNDLVMLDILHHPLLELPQLQRRQRIGATDDRDDVHAHGELAHKLDVELTKGVTGGGDEVDQGVDSIVPEPAAGERRLRGGEWVKTAEIEKGREEG
jgi:hypothetical protein